jgi:hypothetical protein
LGPGALVLFSDSERLARRLAPFFGQPVRVLPIPHAQPLKAALVKAVPWPAGRRPQCIAWWPGRPAPDKGLSHIQSLAAETGELAARMALVAAQGAGLEPTPGGCQLLALPDALPHEAYWSWMMTVDLIVLPYLAEWYAERTSGVFVEAIIAGKPAAVSAGTWMAQEALAHGLPELIVAWDGPGLWGRLLQVATDTHLQPRLAAMQAAYQARHNQARYAEALALAAR